MKDRALHGPAIADEVERLTGVRPAYAAQWISRRLSGTKPLIRIHPDLYVLAEVAGLDPMELIVGALTEAPEESAALVDANPRRVVAYENDHPDTLDT
jgi:hypothetical protein